MAGDLHLIHLSPWNTRVNICKNSIFIKWKQILQRKTSGKYDLIYFDAFGPDKQPEMWTRKMFSGISDVTNKKGILVTYSAKGEVKRSLKACGFEVTSSWSSREKTNDQGGENLKFILSMAFLLPLKYYLRH